MKLSDWLSDKKMTDAEFGRRIGKTHTTVMRLKKGLISPALETLRAIRDVTDGAVTSDDFMDQRPRTSEPRAA